MGPITLLMVTLHVRWWKRDNNVKRLAAPRTVQTLRQCLLQGQETRPVPRIFEPSGYLTFSKKQSEAFHFAVRRWLLGLAKDHEVLRRNLSEARLWLRHTTQCWAQMLRST